MQQSTDTEIVKDLLNLLSQRHPHLCWKMRCLYTNGIDNSVLEIKLQEMPDAHQVCRLAYNPYSGKVMQMKYRGDYFSHPGDVVDVLLDLINLENKKQLVSS
jgi:hypothetical protein